MDKDETLSEFLNRAKQGPGPVLIVSKKEPPKTLAEKVHALLPGSDLLDPGSLAPEELEAFLAKKIAQPEGVVVASLWYKSTPSFPGLLNSLLKQNRVQARTPSGWQTVTAHPSFRMVLVADEAAITLFNHLLRKDDFLYRYIA